MTDTLQWEKYFWAQNIQHVCGLDEAGRGALAGPVVAAAVIFYPDQIPDEINDSKKLTPKKREFLFDKIKESALAYGVGVIDQREIDQINILQASLKAMVLAVEQLKIVPHQLLIDGHIAIPSPLPQKCLVQGDSLSLSIGAASILAKVTRDRLMVDLDKECPGFSFAGHKGYGTKKHKQEIQTHGPTPFHRQSFEPIKSMLALS